MKIVLASILSMFLAVASVRAEVPFHAEFTVSFEDGDEDSLSACADSFDSIFVSTWNSIYGEDLEASNADIAPARLANKAIIDALRSKYSSPKLEWGWFWTGKVIVDGTCRFCAPDRRSLKQLDLNSAHAELEAALLMALQGSGCAAFTDLTSVTVESSSATFADADSTPTLKSTPFQADLTVSFEDGDQDSLSACADSFDGIFVSTWNSIYGEDLEATSADIEPARLANQGLVNNLRSKVSSPKLEWGWFWTGKVIVDGTCRFCAPDRRFKNGLKHLVTASAHADLEAALLTALKESGCAAFTDLTAVTVEANSAALASEADE